MIKLEKTAVMNFENAIRGARNPLESWDRIDSYVSQDGKFILGSNDLELGRRLCRAGSDHRKFVRQIFVSVDITAPIYWWKEFDTYKVGTVANSCSTMHKIHAREFTLDDFSHEHLLDETLTFNIIPTAIFRGLIDCLNENRRLCLQTKDKKYWWQMIQLLPSSYNQKRTVMMNYEVLANIYKSRRNHKLDEWAEHSKEEIIKDALNGSFGFCDWIKTLPYSELITGKEDI